MFAKGKHSYSAHIYFTYLPRLLKLLHVTNRTIYTQTTFY